MNDFTKEELELLKWEVNTAINKSEMLSIPCEKYSALNYKIQFMIDNYCEHDIKYCKSCETSYCDLCRDDD